MPVTCSYMHIYMHLYIYIGFIFIHVYIHKLTFFHDFIVDVLWGLDKYWRNSPEQRVQFVSFHLSLSLTIYMYMYMSCRKRPQNLSLQHSRRKVLAQSLASQSPHKSHKALPAREHIPFRLALLYLMSPWASGVDMKAVVKAWRARRGKASMGKK